jgi:tetratricopeptide (TPR) repeat protein
MRQRIPVKRTSPATRSRLMSTLLTYLPGAWIDPNNQELISLYRLRYRMALEEGKHDAAMIFLNKILELNPLDAEAKFCKGEIYHRCLHDYTQAIEQYNKAIRLTANGTDDKTHSRARAAMSEIMELLS